MTEEPGGNEYIQQLKAEWDALPPALRASSEGDSASLDLLLTNAVKITRALREELGAADPSAEKSLLIALCTSAFQLTITPKPSTDICRVLAAAAIRVMDLEDTAVIMLAKLEILRGEYDTRHHS